MTYTGRSGRALLLTFLFASALRALKLGGHSADLLAAAGAVALVWTGYGLALVPYAVATGCLIHIAGDMCTDSGCPVLAPLSGEDYRLIPEPFAFTTGTAPERWIVRPVLVAAAIAMAVLLAACQAPGHTAAPQDPAPQPLRPVHDPGQVTGTEPASCHFRSGGQLPDPACTPGSYDPAVTQANIGSTICRAGYTATVRPPESQTERAKFDVAYPAYQVPDGTTSELDHLVPLELGGSNDMSNLWPEVGPLPNPKDAVEMALNRAVCAGQVPLAAAQQAIAANWMTAEACLGL